jgi:hypothetical protein
MEFGQVGRARRPNHGAKIALQLLMSASRLHPRKSSSGHNAESDPGEILLLRTLLARTVIVQVQHIFVLSDLGKKPVTMSLPSHV